MKNLLLWLSAFSLLGLSSCATVFGRWHNSLVFENEDGRPAEIFLDGEKIGDAPGKIKLDARRIQQGSRLEIRTDGYPAQEYVLLRRVHGGYTLLNIVATAGLGMAIDFGTGYIYRPDPRKFTYGPPASKD